MITGQMKTLHLEASWIPYTANVLASHRIPSLSFVSAMDIPEIFLVTSLNGYLASQTCETRVEEVASTPDYDAFNINV